MTSGVRELMVPADRAARWIENFEKRHPGTWGNEPAEVVAAARVLAPDGSWFEFHPVLPGPTAHSRVGDGPVLPTAWGVLLVRKGGYAVARMNGTEMVASKVGRRHVQGRTKAGGQSQQRFARRRENQARDAYRAAADHAARVLDGVVSASGATRPYVVVAGDEDALRVVLADPRLRDLEMVHRRVDVHEPRRETLESFVGECTGWMVRVLDTTR